MKASTPFMVLSADKPELEMTSFERCSRRTWFEHKLAQLGYSFKKVAGSHQGKPEISFIVLADNDEELPALYRLAAAFDQDSVMYVDANGYAALFDSDGQYLANLGRFVEVTEDAAQNLDSYTFAGGKYYAIQ